MLHHVGKPVTHEDKAGSFITALIKGDKRDKGGHARMPPGIRPNSCRVSQVMGMRAGVGGIGGCWGWDGGREPICEVVDKQVWGTPSSKA